MKTLLLATVLAVAAILPAKAADITVIERHARADDGSRHPINVLHIQGKILPGDFAKFVAKAAQTPGAYSVALDSGGGNLIEGLKIGEEVREKKMDTVVYADSTCTSVCALIWLAGDRRFASTKAHIGFHAASDKTGRESGSGSAIIGGYMMQLGYNYDAIEWATTAPPTGIQWLNGKTANELGIGWQALVVKQ